MATLLELRTKLNGEVGVADADAIPWAATVRTNAVIDGYAALWRAGVWRPLEQTIATDGDTFVYPLTAIRRLDRVELLDSSSRVIETPQAIAQDDGAGAWELRLRGPVATGYSLRVRGWTAFKSQFSGDADTDDLPAEHNRIPLLKAKAILYRIALASYARYGERQAAPSTMNLTVDQILGIVAAAEREFADEARFLSNLRPRSGQTRRL